MAAASSGALLTVKDIVDPALKVVPVTPKMVASEAERGPIED